MKYSITFRLICVGRKSDDVNITNIFLPSFETKYFFIPKWYCSSKNEKNLSVSSNYRKQFLTKSIKLWNLFYFGESLHVDQAPGLRHGSPNISKFVSRNLMTWIICKVKFWNTFKQKGYAEQFWGLVIQQVLSVLWGSRNITNNACFLLVYIVPGPRVQQNTRCFRIYVWKNLKRSWHFWSKNLNLKYVGK